MRRPCLLILALAFAASGCGAGAENQQETNPYEGRSGQERYCKENGWTYVPATNTCK